MAKELVLIPKAQYEKLISGSQNNEMLNSNSSSTHVHTNANESVGCDNKPSPLLSKPLIRTDEQTNVDHNGEQNATEYEYISKETPGNNAAVKPKSTKEKLHSQKVVRPKKSKKNQVQQ